jgi:hypothetical protein
VSSGIRRLSIGEIWIRNVRKGGGVVGEMEKTVDYTVCGYGHGELHDIDGGA